MNMDTAKFNHWLQIAANVGIVAGLVMVGVQLKQNSDLLRTQILYEESARSIALETQVIGEEGARVWAKAMTEPTELSLEEKRIMEAFLWSYTEQLRGMLLLADLGLMEEHDWKARIESDAGFYFGSRYGLAWWENFSGGTDGSATLSPDLVDAVNDRLSRLDENYTLDYVGGVAEILERSTTVGTASVSDEFLIDEAYEAWEQTTHDKDIDAWSTFIDSEALFMPPGVQPLDTEEAILDYYRAAFADPHFSLDCEQQSVEVSASGELAWSRGICHATFTDSDDQKGQGTSRWFKTWRKQSDGSWKCRVNTWNYEA
jgi:ketosteroid isomerase-like protein